MAAPASTQHPQGHAPCAAVTSSCPQLVDSLVRAVCRASASGDLPCSSGLQGSAGWREDGHEDGNAAPHWRMVHLRSVAYTHLLDMAQVPYPAISDVDRQQANALSLAQAYLRLETQQSGAGEILKGLVGQLQTRCSSTNTTAGSLHGQPQQDGSSMQPMPSGDTRQEHEQLLSLVFSLSQDSQTGTSALRTEADAVAIAPAADRVQGWLRALSGARAAGTWESAPGSHNATVTPDDPCGLLSLASSRALAAAQGTWQPAGNVVHDLSAPAPLLPQWNEAATAPAAVLLGAGRTNALSADGALEGSHVEAGLAALSLPPDLTTALYSRTPKKTVAAMHARPTSAPGTAGTAAWSGLPTDAGTSTETGWSGGGAFLTCLAPGVLDMDATPGHWSCWEGATDAAAKVPHSGESSPVARDTWIARDQGLEGLPAAGFSDAPCTPPVTATNNTTAAHGARTQRADTSAAASRVVEEDVSEAEVVRFSLLGLRGNVSALHVLAAGRARWRGVRAAAQQQLVLRVLECGEARLRLHAFLAHFTWATGTHPGTGAGPSTADATRTAFVCCVGELTQEYDAALQALDEAVQAAQDGKHVTSVQTPRTLAYGPAAPGAVVGGGAAVPPPTTLLELVLQTDALRAVLHLLCGVCGCTPAPGTAGTTPPASATAGWASSPAAPVLRVLHVSHTEGGMGRPLSAWMVCGLAAGTDLLAGLYSGLQQADRALSPYMRRLFVAAATPYLRTLRTWLYGSPETLTASSLVGQRHGGAEQPPPSPLPPPPCLPGFLAHMQAEVDMAGRQHALLAQLAPQLGNLADRFTRIWSRELDGADVSSGTHDCASQSGAAAFPAAFPALHGASGATLFGAGPAHPGHVAGGDGNQLRHVLVFNPNDLKTVTDATARATQACGQELGHMTALLKRRREATSAAHDLAAFARDQAREAEAEAARRAKDAAAGRARAVRAAALAAAAADADAAVTARVTAQRVRQAEEQQALMADALREHSDALAGLQAELAQLTGGAGEAAVPAALLAPAVAATAGDARAGNPPAWLRAAPPAVQAIVAGLQQQLARSQWRMRRLGLGPERRHLWQAIEAQELQELRGTVSRARTAAITAGSDVPTNTSVDTHSPPGLGQGQQLTGQASASAAAPSLLALPPMWHTQSPSACDSTQSQHSGLAQQLPGSDVSRDQQAAPAAAEPVPPSQQGRVQGAERPPAGVPSRSTPRSVSGRAPPPFALHPATPPGTHPGWPARNRRASSDTHSIVGLAPAGLPSGSRRLSSTTSVNAHAAGYTSRRPAPLLRSRSQGHMPGGAVSTPTSAASTPAGAMLGSPPHRKRSSISGDVLSPDAHSPAAQRLMTHGATSAPAARKAWGAATDEGREADQGAGDQGPGWQDALHGADWTNAPVAALPAGMPATPWHDLDHDSEADEGGAEVGPVGWQSSGPATALSEHAPVSTVMEVCVCQPVLAHYWVTTRAMWHVAVHELGVLRTCAALRRYFFFEAGDFALHLKDALSSCWQPLQPHPTSSHPTWGFTRRQASIALTGTLAACPACAADPHASRLSLVPAPPGRDVFGCAAAASSTGLPAGLGPGGLGDSMLLTYDLPWPLDQILCAGDTNRQTSQNSGHPAEGPGGGPGVVALTMRVYTDIASALMRLRVCAAALQRAWLAVGKPTALQLTTGLPVGDGAADAALPPAARATLARRLAACRSWIHEALHFLGALQRHAANTLLGVCWDRFQRRMTQEGPLDLRAMAQCHTDYLVSAAAACFLPPRAWPDSSNPAAESGDSGDASTPSLQAAVALAVTTCEHFASLAVAFADGGDSRAAVTPPERLYPELKTAHQRFSGAALAVCRLLANGACGPEDPELGLARRLHVELDCEWTARRLAAAQHAARG